MKELYNEAFIKMMEATEYNVYVTDAIPYDNTCDVYPDHKQYEMDQHTHDYELITHSK